MSQQSGAEPSGSIWATGDADALSGCSRELPMAFNFPQYGVDDINALNPTIITKDTLSQAQLYSKDIGSSPQNKMNQFQDISYDINQANFGIGTNISNDASDIGNLVDNNDAMSNFGILS